MQATLLLQASCSPISVLRDPFRPVLRRQSYGAPPAPTSYDAPILASSSSSGGGYSQPSTSAGNPGDCVVERSTENTGECQQGGQECTNQCSSVPHQDCSAPAQPVCVTVTEQKCEIQYEVRRGEVAGASLTSCVCRRCMRRCVTGAAARSSAPLWRSRFAPQWRSNNVRL